MRSFEDGVGDFLKDIPVKYHRYIVKEAEQYILLTRDDLDSIYREAKAVIAVEEEREARVKAELETELAKYDLGETPFSLTLTMTTVEVVKHGMPDASITSSFLTTGLAIRWSQHWVGREGVTRVRVRDHARDFSVTFWFETIEDEVLWRLKNT